MQSETRCFLAHYTRCHLQSRPAHVVTAAAVRATHAMHAPLPLTVACTRIPSARTTHSAACSHASPAATMQLISTTLEVTHRMMITGGGAPPFRRVAV